MKKNIILLFLILFNVNFIFANEPDTVGYYSPTISFEVDAKTQIESVKQTLISSDTNRLEIFLSAAISGDSLGVYVNNDFIDTIQIQENILYYSYDINIKNYDNYNLKFYVYYETNNYLAYETLLLNDKGFYSPVVSFEVDAKTQIQSVKQTLISSDTNRLEINLLSAINGDSLGIYVNNDFIDTVIIQDNVLTIYSDVDISDYDNSILKFYVYYETNNYLAYETLLLDDKGFYSPVISFTVNSNAFQFDLTQYISDYSRFKKLAELYSNLQTAISNYSKWRIISIGENDNYYIQPNSDYLKFKRLADKYK